MPRRAVSPALKWLGCPRFDNEDTGVSMNMLIELIMICKSKEAIVGCLGLIASIVLGIYLNVQRGTMFVSSDAGVELNSDGGKP